MTHDNIEFLSSEQDGEEANSIISSTSIISSGKHTTFIFKHLCLSYL